jgi:hypothetical protein
MKILKEPLKLSKAVNKIKLDYSDQDILNAIEAQGFSNTNSNYKKRTWI